MEKSYCSLFLLLTVHLGNVFVIGQSTFDVYSSDEENIVNGLHRFVKDQHILNSDAWIALAKSIQLELQYLKIQISGHDTFLKNSIEEMKLQIQTANNDLKTQILRQEDWAERHDTYLKNL